MIRLDLLLRVEGLRVAKILLGLHILLFGVTTFQSIYLDLTTFPYSYICTLFVCLIYSIGGILYFIVEVYVIRKELTELTKDD